MHLALEHGVEIEAFPFSLLGLLFQFVSKGCTRFRVVSAIAKNAWGRLEEAMELLRKKEALCPELGKYPKPSVTRRAMLTASLAKLIWKLQLFSSVLAFRMPPATCVACAYPIVCTRSIAIAMGVCLMPAPSTIDDVVKLRKAWLPPKFATDLVACRDKYCRIAGAPGAKLHRDWVTCDLAGCLDHFVYRKAQPVSEIVNTATSIKCFEGENVSLCKIDDVNVIAYTVPSLVG